MCRPAIHRYVAVSDDIAGWLETAVGVVPSRIRRIHNGVDADAFRVEGPLPADLPWAHADFDGPLVIGTVARLDPVKNLAALLTAFASVSAMHPATAPRGLRLLIAGDGPLRAELEEQASRLGIGGQVWFTGSRNDVPSLLRAIDVFVLPSLNEGISNTLLEAMATARPVLASRVGGTPEVIRDGVSGKLYDGAGDGALGAALLEYVADPEKRRRHGAAARARIEAAFDLGAMVRGYMDLYDRLAGE